MKIDKLSRKPSKLEASANLLNSLRLALKTKSIEETRYDVSFLIWKSRHGRVDSHFLNNLEQEENLEKFSQFMEGRY